MIHKKRQVSDTFVPRISFVTTCMNRAYSIKKTLVSNIETLKKFGDIEFVLLNYDSKDDLETYVLNECKGYIDSGILNYYKLQENVEFFHMARAKNIVYKLSTGNIVHNVDAEWTMFEPLYHLIKKEFITGEEKKTLHIGGRGGGVVNYKKHFYDIGGYDERMIGWGYDDADFFNRLRFGFNFEHIRTPLAPYASNSFTYRNERNINVPPKFMTDNLKIHNENVKNKNWVVNKNIKWGSANLLKNFKENISI